MDELKKTKLWTSYLETDYVVSDRAVRFVIGIGSPNRELERFLAVQHITNWAFLTAYNPYSVEHSDEDNHRFQRLLFARIRAAKYTFLRGYGKSRHQVWPPEPSVLLFRIALKEAVDLGREFQQNAIVAGSSGKRAELVWCQE